MSATTRPVHVSLVAIPDAVISTLSGIYDVLGSFRMLGRFEPSLPDEPPFTVEIVAAERGSVVLASGVPVEARLAVSEVTATDIIIVPSVLLGPDGWTPELCGNVGDGICSGGGVVAGGFDAVGEFDAFDHFGQLVLPIQLAP
jgi:hypothetical protein